MEVVTSRVEQLGKSKIVHLPPQPTPTMSKQATQTKARKKKNTTPYADWDAKQYKGTETQCKQDRENRRLLREEKQKKNEEELAQKVRELQPLGDEDDEDETETRPEPPVPAPKVIKPGESSAAKNRWYEMERRKKDKAKRDAEKAEAAKDTTEEPPCEESMSNQSECKSEREKSGESFKR